MSATMLDLVEHERGDEAYHTRIIVTAGFMRMDSGKDNDGFLLFDRKDKTTYSINDIDKQILVIRSLPVKIKPPTRFKHQALKDAAVPALPAVGGFEVLHYQLLTNKERCYELYAAPGLLPDVVLALREYYVSLAGQHAATTAFMPRELQSDCDLANNIFLPARQLAHGFPVRLTDAAGKTTELVNYDVNFLAKPELLQLPASYKRLVLDDLQKK
ncbi:MAG: hypothetical protein HY081_12480 [Gammaproteobacteria bacterium]|nr:hypothetical protein [Gammaproteobacteria bacterium]